MNLVPVAVLDDDSGVRDRLVAQLGSRAEPVVSIDALQARLGQAPLVLVLGPSCASASVLAGLASTLQAHRELGTVLVTDELSTDLLQTALRSGVNDVLAAPVDTEQLAAAVARVAEGLDVSGAQRPGRRSLQTSARSGADRWTAHR